MNSFHVEQELAEIYLKSKWIPFSPPLALVSSGLE